MEPVQQVVLQEGVEELIVWVEKTVRNLRSGEELNACRFVLDS